MATVNWVDKIGTDERCYVGDFVPTWLSVYTTAFGGDYAPIGDVLTVDMDVRSRYQTGDFLNNPLLEADLPKPHLATAANSVNSMLPASFTAVARIDGTDTVDSWSVDTVNVKYPSGVIPGYLGSSNVAVIDSSSGSTATVIIYVEAGTENLGYPDEYVQLQVTLTAYIGGTEVQLTMDVGYDTVWF